MFCRNLLSKNIVKKQLFFFFLRNKISCKLNVGVPLWNIWSRRLQMIRIEKVFLSDEYDFIRVFMLDKTIYINLNYNEKKWGNDFLFESIQ